MYTLSGDSMEKYNQSLQRLLSFNSLLENKIRGLPYLGTNLHNNGFSKEVKKIESVFRVYGNELHELENPRIENIKTRSLGGGSPMENEAFPPCKRKLKNLINSEFLSEYPLAAGDEESRNEIVEYLKKEGFKNHVPITKDNIIFTISTTNAFSMICKLIAKPHDVILMTAPSYGLFSFVPERDSGASTMFLELSEDDNWYVNPTKLSNKIDEINKNLEVEFGGKLDYIPKVVGFLNENPHNPLGKVMSSKNKHILEKIGDICLDKGVFVIDDIIYRDLTFDRDNLALPLATYKKHFDNTITLMGLSKSYGMAAIRAGMIVANPIICRGIRNQIFQTMDSSPIFQAKALAAAFNSSKGRYREYEKYFTLVIKEYKYRYDLLKALVEGIDSIENQKTKILIKKDIKKYLSKSYKEEEILNGIRDVSLVKKTELESGFFVLLDFTKLKNKSANKRTILNEEELLKYLYEREKIKIILGQSISWPDSSQLIGRVTTALERKEIIERISAMNRCLRDLR